MEILHGFTIFYFIRFLIITIILLLIFLFFFVMPKKTKKIIATTIINNCSEQLFAILNIIFFVLTICISIYISERVMLAIKLNSVYKINIICSAIECIKIIFKLESGVVSKMFLHLKNALYHYISF